MRPPVVWMPPPVEWAEKLRGRAYFSSLLREVQIVTPPGSNVWITSRTAVISYMPTILVDRCRFIADVTADPLHLMDDPSRAMRDAWDEATPADAEIYWSRPDVLRQHADALKASTLIMTSWAEMVEPLWEFAARPVVHVPDYQGRFGWAFRRGMRQVWRELDAAHDWSTG